MNIKKFAFFAPFLLVLTACQVVPLNNPPIAATPNTYSITAKNNNIVSGDMREVDKLSYRDDTMSPYYRYFQPTQQSKSVMTGSAYQAEVSGCTFMQRYRVRTNADFQGSINLFKYRAYEMGAERVVIVKHEEIDAHEGKVFVDDTFFVGTVGTDIQNADFFTIIIGDLYDCPNANNQIN